MLVSLLLFHKIWEILEVYLVSKTIFFIFVKFSPRFSVRLSTLKSKTFKGIVSQDWEDVPYRWKQLLIPNRVLRYIFNNMSNGMSKSRR